MAEKKSFILYFDNAKQVNMLTDEQAGKLFKAIFKFAETGEETEFDDLALGIVFSFIADIIRRDTEKYDDICKKRSDSGKKSAKMRANASFVEQNGTNAIFAEQNGTNAIFVEQNGTNSTDNDNENDNENENDIVNGNGKDNDSSNSAGNFRQNLGFAPSSSTQQNFLKNFNNICKSFNSVSKISDNDRKNISEILANFTEKEINQTFEKIEKSDFLKGKKKHPNKKYEDWKANFSWIIKYDNFLNAFNGNYDNKEKFSHNDEDFDVNMYKEFINDFTVI